MLTKASHLIPRSPLEPELKPHTLLALRLIWIWLDNLIFQRFFGWRLKSLFVENVKGRSECDELISLQKLNYHNTVEILGTS